MEITVRIDGRDVCFKKTGGTMRRYKSMFGREWFADLDRIARMQRKAADALKKAKLDKLAADGKKSGKETDGKKSAKAADAVKALSTDQIYAISGVVAESYDSEPFYDMLYTMAREADSSVPDTVDAWLDTFDDFAFLEVWASVSPMLSREMSVDAKNG